MITGMKRLSTGENFFLVEARGFEPLTSGMQILRSAKLSYAPEKIGCGDRI
jgi:hypothetical protein